MKCLTVGRMLAAALVACMISCGGMPRNPPDSVAAANRSDAVAAVPHALAVQPRKFVIAVVAEGYGSGTAADGSGTQADFDADFNKLFTNGAMLFEPFAQNAALFEVRAIPLVSRTVGVSATVQDTALGLQVGSAKDCYFKASSDSLRKISEAARDVDYVVVLINAPGNDDVGCAVSANLTFIGRRVAAAIVVHELGHAIGDLFDEYPAGVTDAMTATSGNCSTATSGETCSWRDLFQKNPVVPPTATDSNLEIGMYEGCNHRVSGIYRPTMSCMMFAANDDFCRVCSRILDNVIKAGPRTSPASPAEPYVYFRFLVKSGTHAEPEIVDRWNSNRPPSEKMQPMHGVWALTIDNKVIGAAPATGQPFSWRAYGPAPHPLPEKERYLPAPYHFVEIGIPRDRVPKQMLNPPELRFHSFGTRVERFGPGASDVSDLPDSPLLVGRSPALNSAIQSLQQ